MNKKYILRCVIVSLVLPMLIQDPLNRIFRDLFNPEGWNILQPQYRVISTLICIVITYITGRPLLVKANAQWWLYILHAVCTLCWGVLYAMVWYIIITS